MKTAFCADLVTLSPQCANEFNKCILRTHNKLRSTHKVGNLTVDLSLQEKATAFSEKMAVENFFAHSKGLAVLRMGENLAVGFRSNGFDVKRCGQIGKMFAEKWYNEIENYDFETGSKIRGMIGHFTQVVWKGTKRVGCGLAISTGNKAYITCNYLPG
ncbi:Golgi-associated plant pathogenesis-related 1, partial [Brachionus plicatilis]